MNVAFLRAIWREARISTLRQPVSTIVTALIVAALMVAVLLTTGRTVAAEQAVASTIESPSSRLVSIRFGAEAGVTVDALEPLQRIHQVQWVGAFGRVRDVRNALVPGGSPAAMRIVWTDDPAGIGLPEAHPTDGLFATPAAMQALGIDDATAPVRSFAGVDYWIIGQFRLAAGFAQLDPAVLRPQPLAAAGDQAVSTILLLMESADDVELVTRTLPYYFANVKSDQLNISASLGVAELRDRVQSELSSYSRALLLGILAVAGTLVGALLYGLVLLRRKDFGRRRALGATRGLIVGLVLLQTAMQVAIGIVLGAGIGYAILLASGDALPSLSFTGGLAVLTLGVSLLAAVLPAVAASRRDPLKELRVP